MDEFSTYIATLDAEAFESEVRALFHLLPSDKSDIVNVKLLACYRECLARKDFGIYERAYESLGLHQYF